MAVDENLISTQRLMETISALHAFSLEVGAQYDTSNLLRLIVRAALEHTRAANVHLYLYDQASDRLTFGASLWSDGTADQEVSQPRPNGTTYTAARSGKRIVITDPGSDPLLTDVIQTGAWAQIKTYASVPLRSGDEVIGVLNLAFDREGALDHDMLQFLDLLAAQAAVAFQSVRLYEAERAATARAQAMLEAALILSSKLTTPEVLEEVLRECAQVLPFTSGSIMILEDGTPALLALAGYEGREDAVVPITRDVVRDSPLLKQIILTQQPVLVPDVRDAPEWVVYPETQHIRCWLGVPLLARDEVIGILSLESDQPAIYTREHVEIARGLAAHAAAAVENARLFDRTQEALAQLETFFRAGQALIAAGEPEQALAAMVAPFLEAGASSAALLYFDLGRGDQPEFAEVVARVGQHTRAQGWAAHARFRVADFALGRLLTASPHEVHLISDLQGRTELNEPALQLLAEGHVRALAAIPLVLQGRWVGAVTIHWPEPHHFTSREHQFLSVVSGQLAAILESQRLLEKARRAQERFHDIALSTSDWLWEVDAVGTLTYCSERIVEFLGYAPSELIGRSLFETLLPPEEAERVRQVFDSHARESRRIDGLQYWGLHKDGHRVFLSTSGVPIRDPQRGLIGFRGVTKDITAQHQAEQRERMAYEIGQRMTALLSLDELTEMIVHQVQEAFDFYHVHLFLYDGQARNLRMQSGTGEAGRRLKESEFCIPLRARPSLIARAARTFQPVISNNTRRDPDYLPNILLPETRSEAAFPLCRGNRLLGVLDMQAAEVGRFTSAEVRTLESLAVHASIAIENALLYEAERAARSRSEVLLEVARALSSTLGLETLLHKILDECAKVLSFKTGSILIYEGHTPIMAATSGYGDHTARIIEESKEQLVHSPILKRMMRDLQPVILADVRENPEWISFDATGHIRGWMGVPLISRGQMIGVLMLDSQEVGAYTQEHLAIAQGLAAHAAVAIENARLYQALEQQASHLEDLVAERTTEVVRERERLRAIVESAGEGIIFTSAEGVIEFANAAWERLSGYRAADVIGQHFSALYDASSVPLAEGLKQLQAGQVWEREARARRADGSEYDMSITFAPVVEGNGKVVHLVGVFRDITAQKEVDRMRKKFLANVSHELRTPVTSLKLFHTLLRSGPPERRDEYLDTMDAELQRLERLIEDLLDISRIDRGVLTIRPEPLDLNELVQGVMRAHLLRAEERGLHLELDLYPDLPPLFVDRERMTQVLVNLLTNAINFTSPGDRIGVRTGLTRQEGTSAATLTVWDSGMGIAPEDLPFVFNRFFRAETAKVEGIPGTGLGLSIVREIVEMHGGTVRAESTLGEGSAFTVYLPIEGLVR